MPTLPNGDPTLKGRDWLAVRRYWIAQGMPCSVCGVQIDYRPNYRGPLSLDVGHIVSRTEAQRMGWTRQMMNALSNTRPECRTCNRSHGARLGNAQRRVRNAIESDEW